LEGFSEDLEVLALLGGPDRQRTASRFDTVNFDDEGFSSSTPAEAVIARTLN
jgi:hypothetical protein